MSDSRHPAGAGGLAAQDLLPQGEERLELHAVGVEELLDGEPVGHGDHQRGETAQARVVLGAVRLPWPPA